MKTILSLFCVILCGLLWSCSPIQSYSPIPEIHFVSLSFEDVNTPLGIQKMAVLTFSFIDGDGDIGAKTENCNSRIHYTWYKKLSDGNYEPFVFPATGTTTDSIAIPWDRVMDREGAQNKLLRGTIRMELTMPRNPQDADYMHIRYFIFDRARNQSNIDRTPDFNILDLPDIIHP